MANFCRFCGSPLAEGQVCACQANQAAYQAQQAPAYQAPAYQAAPVATAAPKSNILLNTLKSYFKAPKATAAAAAQDKQGMAVAGIFAGVNALAVFFFIWRFIGMWVGKCAEARDVSVSKLIEDYWDLSYPVFPMLLAGVAIAAIGIAATALVVFLVAKFNKQTVDLKNQFVVAAVHSFVPSLLLVAGILLSLVAWWFYIVVLGMILVLWFVNICGEANQGENLLANAGVVFAGLLVAILLTSVLTNWSLGATERDAFEDEKLCDYYEEADKSIWHIFADDLMIEIDD